MSKPLTLTPEALQQLIAQAVASALATQTAERKDAAVAAAKAGKSERSVQNEIAAVRAFKKAGYGDVKPREDVKTYSRWLADGRKVKPGEKAIKVKNLRLFHIKQTEAISAEEKADAVASMQEAIRKHNEKAKAAKATPRSDGQNAKADQTQVYQG